MHEWALADAVVSTLVETSKKENLKEIIEVKIKIGELQQIDEEIFRFALKEIIEERVRNQDSSLKNMKIKMEKEPSFLKCRVCGHEWDFESESKKLSEEESESIHFIPEAAFVYIRCPMCKSPDFEIIKGRGVWIDSIEGRR
jgi:hydrogenase nickel incorporation protein HypA/HybF